MATATTLRQAPVIVTNLYSGAAVWQERVLQDAARRIRRDYEKAPNEAGEGNTLRKLDGDIWALKDSAIGFHRDKTAAYHRVLGVVLVNDPGYMLYQNQMVWDLPVGTVYHIDGRRTHGAIERNEKRTGLFGFLAWDVPATTPLSELMADLLPSLEAYAKGEVRMNVLVEK